MPKCHCQCAKHCLPKRENAIFTKIITGHDTFEYAVRVMDWIDTESV